MSKTTHNIMNDRSERFDRLSYWRALAANTAEPVFAYPLATCLALSPVDRDAINAAVFEIIANSMNCVNVAADMQTSEARANLIRALNDTTRFSIDVAANLDRLTALEAKLVEVFGRLGLMEQITGWQFPLDIRVVHPAAPERYLDRKDATDYLHCDPWRGEPEDIVNIVLYCEAGERASQLELYAVDPADLGPFQTYNGDERAAESLLGAAAPVVFEHRPGQIIVFDGYLPHRTHRLGDCVRVSLNFSMRRANPYAVIDERWDRERQAWDKFWFVNDGSQTTFAARWQREMERIAELETDAALLARRSALVKHFDVHVSTTLLSRNEDLT